MIKRGELWLVDWSPGRGSEQQGVRPAVIVQTDAANTNPHYPNTMVATVSTKGKNIPFHIALQPSPTNGLTQRSFVKCEQILTISKERLLRRIGLLETQEMDKIDQTLKKVLFLS